MTRNIFIKIAATIFLVLSLHLETCFPQQNPTEYELKATFLFHFARFVQWPATAFQSPSDPIVIGILGEDPFGAYLDRLLENKQIKGHPLMVNRYTDIHEVTNCYILFISRNYQNHLKDIFSILRDKNVLTVSEIRHFAVHGGMIKLFTRAHKIRFAINYNAVLRANLKMSSRLLRLAQIVDEQDDALKH